jgi:hypothetical protein
MVLAASGLLAQAPPSVVSSLGYINGTPLTAHTTAAFNSTGATTLVAFVSTHPNWPQPAGPPVSIAGLTDNLGNTWSLLAGPTTWAGSTYTMVSAIYYVNLPATSAAHMLTVNFTNPAPLVLDMFAISGADVTGPPIVSAIGDPGTGGISSSVTTAPIAVPANSLLLAWAKNETTATATAAGGFNLDSQSTSFLWAESQTTLSAGSYTGQFQYSAPIGWQAAVVGLKPSIAPLAFNQSVTANFNSPANVTLMAASPLGYPLTYSVLTAPSHGALGGTAPNLTYTPNAGYVGGDAFTFRASDGTLSSNVATVGITVLGPSPPTSSVGYINGAALTSHTTGVFNTAGASTIVAFVSTYSTWPQPGAGQSVSINSLTDNLGNSWKLLVGPTTWSGSAYTQLSAIYYSNAPITSANHTLTVTLTNPAPLVLHAFAVSGSDVTSPPIVSAIANPGVGGTSANVTTAPIAVSANSVLLAWAKNETAAAASAAGGYTLDSQSTGYLWAESQTALAAGSYTGQFQYSAPIGWQTAVVAVTASNGPVASNQAITTNFNTPASITLAASSRSGLTLSYGVVSGPANGTLSGSAPNLTYTPNAGYAGTDSFTFQASDGTVNSNLATVAITVRSPSASTASIGYLNGAALTSHTTAPFNSVGASTIVAFVSTYSTWPQPGQGQPVSITGITDNLGNTWNLLAGPTIWSGSSYTQLSAIYYVHAPLTSANHTITATLSNGAPLVLHAFAVSGSDVTGPPIVSAITNPGAGGASATVITTPISVPANAAVLAWAKNEAGAGATALGSYTLDSQSTGYLWAESQTALAAGSVTGQFQYSATIGWQAAIVGLKTSNGPLAFNQAIATNFNTPANIALTATSRKGLKLKYSIIAGPTNGALSGIFPNITYIPNAGYAGSDAFTFLANDGSNSNVATVGVTVRGPYPSTSSLGYDSSTPLSTHTTAAFNSSGATTLVAFVGTHPTWPQPGAGQPVGITSVTDNLGNTWRLLAGPTSWAGSSFSLLASIYYVNAPVTGSNHTLSVTLSNPAPLVLHAFAVSGTDVTGPPIVSAITNPPVGGASNVTTAPIAVPANSALLAWAKNETSTTATAAGGFTLDPQSVSFLSAESQTALAAGSYMGQFQYSTPIGWQTAIVGLKPSSTAVPVPAITSTPLNPTNQTGAAFSFTDTLPGTSFQCQFDGSAFSSCSSPISYPGLSQGSHAFSVRAQDTAGNLSTAASFMWAIDLTPPPAPSITSAPANPSNQTNPSFSFSDTEAGASFLCQLDGGVFSVCSSPAPYASLAPGSHTFAVIAQDAAGNQSPVTSSTWSIVAITYVQGNYAVPQSPQTAVSVTFNAAQAVGDLNVIVVGWNNSTSTVTGVTDTSGNIYTLAVGPTVVSGFASQSIYYAQNIAAASAGANTAMVTFSSAAVFPDIRILEYSGLDPNNPVDVTAAATGNSGTSGSGSATTTTASDLIFGANLVQTSTTGAGSGFTKRLLTSPDGDIAEDRLVASAGSYGATAPVSSGQWIMQMVAFRTPVGTLTTVNAVNPNTGLATGGTAVTITGADFAPGDTVTFGGAAATGVAVVNSSTITAITPAGTGVVNVAVTNAAGLSGVLTGGFSYIPPPAVSGVSPNSGALAGGTPVTITGTNFAAGATVTFGAATAANVTIVNSTTITATTPAGSAGAVTVAVTNSNGLSGSLAGAFTYAAAPTITGVSPNSGSTAGGTAVTITGTNFVAGATVMFGGAAATGITVVNRTTIRATTPPGAVGPAIVAVTSSNQTASLANGFTYAAIISYVQGNYATPQTPQTSVSVAFTSAQAVGDLNVVVVGWNDSTATVTGVTDGSGNAYTLAVGPTVVSGLASQSIYYAKNILAAGAGANAVTVTFSAPAKFPDIRVLEYNGANPTNPVDVTASASGTSTNSNSGSVNTTNPADLIFGANLVQTTTSGAGSGFTRRLLTIPDGDIAEDRMVTATGTYSATAPLSSGPWIMQMVAFRAP